jgi:iron complex outermembrane receptor protein
VVTLRSGITSAGDGGMGIALITVHLYNGFINYTIDLSQSQLANRPGTVDAAGKQLTSDRSFLTFSRFS